MTGDSVDSLFPRKAALSFFITGKKAKEGRGFDYSYIPATCTDSGDLEIGKVIGPFPGTDRLSTALMSHEASLGVLDRKTVPSSYDFDNVLFHARTEGDPKEDELIQKGLRDGGMTLSVQEREGWKTRIHRGGQTYRADGRAGSKDSLKPIQSWVPRTRRCVE